MKALGGRTGPVQYARLEDKTEAKERKESSLSSVTHSEDLKEQSGPTQALPVVAQRRGRRATRARHISSRHAKRANF